MADSIADLNIALRATADKLAADINRGIKGAESHVSTKAVALGTVIGVGIVAGLGAAMAGIKKTIGLAFEGLDRIDALDEAATKIGLSYNAMQDLKLAAVTTGASFEGMASAIAKMQGNISNGSAEEALQKLGLSAQFLRDLAPEKQFAEIAQKLSEVKNTGDKIDLTKSIFGKGGVDILNVINGGKEGMAEIARTAELFGGHLTDAQRAMATMAQGDIETLKAGWGYIKDQIAVGVAPAMFSMTQNIVKFAEESGGIAKMIQGWSDSAMEFAATVADAFQNIRNTFKVLGAVKDDANIWSVSPILAFIKASKATDAELQKIIVTQKSAGDVMRQQYAERKAAAEQVGATERNLANEKISNDKAVALNFGDASDEMSAAYDANMKKMMQQTYDFNLAVDQAWEKIPGRAKASLEGVIKEYTSATGSLSAILLDWAEKMVQSFVTVGGLMSIAINNSNASDWWKKANSFLQSLGKKGLEDGAGQATLDNMKSITGQNLSPSERAQADSANARKASQEREAARVAANRAESQAKSAARKAGIGGSMKIGSFDASFTAPAMSQRAPSFFPGGNAKSPAMSASASGGTLGGTTINQYFASGVTRAELAGSMDEVKDATLGAVLNAFTSGGGFRNALKA